MVARPARPQRMGRRRLAAALAALAPLALLGIGQVDAQFTDSAAVNNVRIASAQLPSATLRCTQSGLAGFREVVLRWDPAPAGGPYTYRIVVKQGASTVTDTNLGGALNWSVPYGLAWTTTSYVATLYVTGGSWVSPVSNSVTFTLAGLDEYCT